ncbi:hypothetical protein SCHPADRAFT_803526, partial [Schizopora paradoxa]
RPPILTAGKPSPLCFQQWETGCLAYFEIKAVDAAVQVQRVAPGLQDTLVQAWYSAYREAFNAMEFTEFMAELRAEFLDSDWAEKICLDIGEMRQDKKPWSEYLNDVLQQNSLIRGTPEHMDDTLLRYHLHSNMDPILRDRAKRDGSGTAVTFKLWKDIVRKSAEGLRNDELRFQNMVQAEVARQQKKTGIVNKPSRNANTSAATTDAAVGKQKNCPPLAPGERLLLDKHSGCTKCRRFYVDHRAKTCPNPFPDPATYKPLTEREALMAKTKNSSNAAPAAAVHELDENENSNLLVAAFVDDPDLPSNVLGNGTDSEEYVSPLHHPHLYWDCHVDGPSSPSPIRCRALIDHGSHTVLIDESLVQHLGLRRRRLHTPLKIGMAISEGNSGKELREWVKIKPVSLDGRWSSRTLRAVIAPQLCAPILLGGPFLFSNKIVVDHESRSVIAKDNNYNLLQPSPPVPARNDSLHCADESAGLVAAIRDRIEAIAEQEALEKRAELLRQEFADRFPTELPPVTNLPTDVFHEFTLKDPNREIKSRQYACPKKWQEPWK